MSHLAHEVCGCDFFILFSPFDTKVLHIVHILKEYLKENKVTFYSSDSFAYDHNYIETLLLQSIRSKIFIFFIDKYSIESDLFLYLYQYAKSYKNSNYLPILIPVLCEESLNEPSSKIATSLTDGCMLNFKISQVNLVESFLASLRESIKELVPICKHGINNFVRHDDRFRPKNSAEEAFITKMKDLEPDLMNNMVISSTSIKCLFPAHRIISFLSIPHASLKSHIDKMLSADFHLTWVDSVFINKANYFSLLWTANDARHSATRHARPPQYLVFYDLNPAQLASIYSQYISNNWSMEFLESYIRHKDSVLLNRRRPKSRKCPKSNEEINYFCQLKYCPGKELNKLRHSVIDSRFSLVNGEISPATKNKFLVPVRHTRVSMNVNVVNNAHFYHSMLIRPIDLEDKSCFGTNRILDENESVVVDNVYQIRDNLTDGDLMEVYEELNRSGWRMIDLKAYKDIKCDVKFSAIWTSLESFREGTSLLFMGVTKSELDKIAEKLKTNHLYPKLVTNYGYVNIKHEHVYAVYFTQD